MRNTVIDAFFQRYGTPPDFLVRCPGRVNLIGEHTDYNDGWVLPMAIDRALWVACRRSTNHTVRLDSLDLEGSVVFELGAQQPEGPTWPTWGAYVWSVARQLTKDRDTRKIGTGIEGIIASEIPVGAGLSSSAALELAIARALLAASEQPWDAREMALLCHRAESQNVGVACGVMDQMIVASAVEGCALLIDCRSLQCSALALPKDLVVAVLDTGTRRNLGVTGEAASPTDSGPSSSAFNRRREQCAAAATALGVASLRDVELGSLEGSNLPLSDVQLRRARHVTSENQRVLAFATALENSKLDELGKLMRDSHRSLRDDYDVVTPALDAIVTAALEAPGCVGARMTGAGFGGCAVALVERAAAQDFAVAVSADYARRVRLDLYQGPSQESCAGQVHLCEATAGVGLDHSPLSL